MNLRRLHAERYRSYDRIDLELPEGAIAIAGANGSGKSSLVELVPLCLFGPEGRSLAPYLNEDEHDAPLVISIEFEHAGAELRVRRTYSPRGRGQAKVDFEEFVDGTWEPRTRESAAETQAEIERVLGLSRQTFCSSAYLGQGNADAFTSAAPRERKAILADVLGLQRWEQLLELVRVDKRQTERAHSELAGRISVLEERSGDTAELEGVCSRLRALLGDLEQEHARAGASLEEAALAVRAQERAEATYRERAAAVEAASARAEARKAIVDRAAAAKTEAVEVQKAIAAAGDASTWIAELETKRRELHAQAELRREAESTRDRYLADATDAEREVERIRAERAQVEQEIARLDAEIGSIDDPVRGAHCPTCAQELRGDSRDTVVERLGQARDEAVRRVTAYERRISEGSERAAARNAAAAAVAIPDAPAAEQVAALDHELANARQAEIHVATLREQLRSLEQTIAELTPEVMAEVEAANRALLDARAALSEIEPPSAGVLAQCQATALAARGRLAEVQARLTQAQAELAAANARLEAARETFVELEQARLRALEHAAELEHLATLERAYGRDGIPSLIVETSAIPQIEAEANRILVELGTPYRVELRTQRELKSGDGLADTLDVVVIGDVGARPYETFSGGERSRLNVALRIALARLLAHRRGAESRLLCLDEVEYLDAAGQMALAGVLIELAREEFDRVISVSHADALRETFDTTIVVTKEGGRSRIVGDRELVAA